MHSVLSLPTIGLFVCALAACGPTSAANGTADGGGTSAAGASGCADFGGTCAKGSSSNPSPDCAAGTVPVVEGASCAGALDVCCVPAKMAGSVELHGTAGLVCTDNAFKGVAAGRCDNREGVAVGCEVGCACGTTAGKLSCDCSRGLPVTKAGKVECAAFDCGTIMCGVGCSCGDPQSGRCDCK